MLTAPRHESTADRERKQRILRFLFGPASCGVAETLLECVGYNSGVTTPPGNPLYPAASEYLERMSASRDFGDGSGGYKLVT